MKHVKRLFAGLLIMSVLFGGGLLNCGITASAASLSYPTKLHIGLGYANADAIEIKLASAGDKIKNIKSSSKNLIAYQTSLDIYRSSDSPSSDRNAAGIGVYAKKKGTYTVKFSIYGKNGKKKSTKSVKIYANNDSAVKSFKVDGKDIHSLNYVNKKTAKIKVTMNKGYKLKKIEVGTYKHTKSGNNTESEMKYKKIKNGSKITLGTKPYYYGHKYEDTDPYNSNYYYYSENWNKGMTATTEIRITYTDKYTKQTATTYYVIDKLLKK